MLDRNPTLDRIESLSKLVRTGYHSNALNTTIAKLVEMEQSRLQAEAEKLSAHLVTFEQRYQLSSEEFARRFQEGVLGDEADFFEWSAFYQMWLSTQARLEALRV